MLISKYNTTKVTVKPVSKIKDEDLDDDKKMNMFMMFISMVVTRQ